MVKICSRCVMDSSIPGIRFDENGVCNYCNIQDEWKKRFPQNEKGFRKLDQIINEIKAKGKNKKYDCVIGVSGGVDSSYTLYLAIKKLDLRPVVVHLDNGWNSEIAIDNIKKMVERLGVEIIFLTCDWDEFRDLQISFLKASVPDVEIPTDIAIVSVLYKVAAEKGIKYVITGTSFSTEGKVPIAWTYMDGKYIKSVQKIFGKKKLKSFPNFTLFDRLYYKHVKGIKTVNLLNYIDYRKKEVKKILEDELGWKSYGGKHYESIYTRFIQSYLLPKKFNIDKRKVHFSALVNSGQMTRDESLTKLKEYPHPEEKIKDDMDHVLKKLELSKEEFEEIFARPPKSFLDYSTSYSTTRRLKIPLKLMYRFISSAPPTIFEEMKFFEEDMKNR